MQLPSLSFMDGINLGHHLWFFESRLKALCSLDMKTGEVAIEAVYENPVQIGRILYYHDQLFLFFQNGFSVLVYSLSNHSFRRVDGDENEIGWAEPKIMSQHVLIGKKVYIIPVMAACEAGKIILSTFDLAKEQFMRHAIYPQDQSIKDSHYEFYYPGITGNSLYSGHYSYNQYIYIDFIRGEYILKDIERKDVFPYAVCGDGERVWMTQQENPDIYCEMPSGALMCFPVETVHHQPYSRIVNLADHIAVLPRYSDKLILINKKELRQYTIPLSIFLADTINPECSKSYSCSENDSYIFVHPLGMERIVAIRKNDCFVHNVRTWSNASKFFRAFQNKHGMWNEDIFIFTLRNFIEMNLSCVPSSLQINMNVPSVGNEIYLKMLADFESI